MVRIPRDVRPADLIRVLRGLGFVIVRQTGSHVMLTHPGPPECHVAVPDHRFLSVGVVHSVLKACEIELRIEPDEILSKL